MLLNLTQRVSISLQNLSQLRVVSCSSDILKRTSFREFEIKTQTLQCMCCKFKILEMLKKTIF